MAPELTFISRIFQPLSRGLTGFRPNWAGRRFG